MKTNNHDSGSEKEITPSSPGDDTLRIEYRIGFIGGGEEPMVVEGFSERSLALRAEFIHATQHSFPEFFEQIIKNTTLIAATVFLQGRYQRIRNSMATKQPVSTAEDCYCPEPQAHTAGHGRSPENIAAMLLAAGSLVDEETVMPQMPFPPERPPASAHVGCRIVNPVQKSPAKPPRSPKASVAALPGDKGEKMAA